MSTVLESTQSRDPRGLEAAAVTLLGSGESQSGHTERSNQLSKSPVPGESTFDTLAEKPINPVGDDRWFA